MKLNSWAWVPVATRARGQDGGGERAENSVSLRASVEPGARDSISTNRGSAWGCPGAAGAHMGPSAGAGIHTRGSPSTNSSAPCLGGACWSVETDRVSKDLAGPGPWATMTITTAIIVNTDGASPICSFHPHNSPVRQAHFGDEEAESSVSSQWGAGLWTSIGAQRCVVLGMKPRQGPGVGLGHQGGDKSPEVRAWEGPGRAAGSPEGCATEAPGHIGTPFSASVSSSGDWRVTLTCSISPPGSLRLGCTSELRWGRGAGRDGIPGSVLTSCLVSCPRGAVLHVNGHAECHSGTWGCLQNDRPLQVSPPTPPPSWPQLLLSARSPPLHYLISPLYHSLRWLWLICPFFR